MSFQEQNQLFRFNWNYFVHFLSKPGGLSEYIGAFFIQFYLNPIAGAFIVTFTGIAAFILARYIFKKLTVTGIIWTLIPVVLLIQQSEYMFKLENVIAQLLVLLFFAIYISIRNDSYRLVLGVTGGIFLYLACGGFSFIAVLLFILYELLYSKSRFRIFAASSLLLIAVVFPYFASRTIYFIPTREIWFDPNLSVFRELSKYSLLLFPVYFALTLILKKFTPASIKSWFHLEWNRKTILAGAVIILALFWGIKKYVYDTKLRLFLEMDYNVQLEKWDKVLELSSQSQGTNRLILYYTNLALYKTGHLGDKLFYFRQMGIPGLWLDRGKDEISLFLGGGIFYDMGNFNEATRWACDAMIANGQNPPRLLKQLVLTALVNGDMGIAENYLNILDESIYYKDWAKHYLNYLSDPDLLLKDPEIAAKRHMMVQNDFVASKDRSDIGLKYLLENHADNRMAFEYYMTSLLLSKNLKVFAANIDRIADLGYKEIPVHFEEALLIYMSLAKIDAVPKGFGIRESTIQRFQEYTKLYASKFRNPASAAKSLAEYFDNTYWFYWHFINNVVPSNESNHLFN